MICCILITLPIVAAIGVTGRPSVIDETKPAVSLVLTKVSAERQKQDTFFRCDVILDNATGKELEVHSNFFSAFDGLELVVTNGDRRVLAQQAYTFHQSPLDPSPGRCFPLEQGSTKGTLGFPVSDLPTSTTALKVRLVGTLPGSVYRRILSSETLEVKVKAHAPE